MKTELNIEGPGLELRASFNPAKALHMLAETVEKMAEVAAKSGKAIQGEKKEKEG